MFSVTSTSDYQGTIGKEKPFVHFTLNWDTEVVSAIHIYAESGMEWTTESDIHAAVSVVARTVIRSLNMQPKRDDSNAVVEVGINVFHEVAFDGGVRPDICLVCILLNGEWVPIGFIEVKKPSDTPEEDVDNPYVLGQVRAYLLHFQSTYGIARPFGIVTTYERWRIAWLPDPENDRVAASGVEQPLDLRLGDVTDLHILKVAEAKKLAGDSDAPTSNKMQDVPAAKTRNGKKEEENWPVIHVSRWYHYKEHPDVATAIGTAIKIMGSSPHLPREILNVTQHRLMVSSTRSTVAVEIPEFRREDFRLAPVRKVDHLFLLHDLGNGRDGRVWLCATTGGRGHVIKFLKRRIDGVPVDVEKTGPGEALLWSRLYDLNAFSARFADKVSVVMPYVHPLTDAEWEDLMIIGMIKTALRTIAQKGFIHRDVKRLHTGSILRHGQREIVLVDLTDVEEIEEDVRKDKTKKDAWIKAAQKKMMGDLGLAD